MNWVLDGQLLAVGSQKRNLQLYDLRVSGTNAPPISVFAHSDAVAGIVPDGNCPTKSVFASFGRNLREPVKIWDARMMNSTVGEIRVGPCSSNPNLGISSIAWLPDRYGFLAVAIGDTIKTYDTKTPGSRSLPVEVSYMDSDDRFIQDLAFQPQVFCGVNFAPLPSIPKDGLSALKRTYVNTFEFFPHRALVVSSKGDTIIVPESHAAPLAISKRDGRIAHGMGSHIWIGDTVEGKYSDLADSLSFLTAIFLSVCRFLCSPGPSAMEGNKLLATEDVSARMMRRARCLHSYRYSTDASNNVKMFEDERNQLLRQNNEGSIETDFNSTLSDINQLVRVWRWISLVEELCRMEQREGEDNVINSNNSSMNFNSSHSGFSEEASWTAKGLLDAGVMKLLRMSSRDSPDDTNWMDSKSTSESLFCDEYDSPMRR